MLGSSYAHKLQLSCRIINSFDNPAVTNRACAQSILLPFWDHLVSPAEITILPPSLITYLGSGQTGSVVPSMSISKRHLVQKIYLYILYTTDI
jgi:hypothetical protein